MMKKKKLAFKKITIEKLSKEQYQFIIGGGGPPRKTKGVGPKCETEPPG